MRPIHSAARWSWVTVLTASLLLSFVHRGLLSVLVTPIERELALDDLEMGELQGPAFAIVLAIATVVFGRVADTWRRRELLALGIAVWCVGAVLCASAQGFAGLAGGRVLTGMGIAAVTPIGIAIIGDAFPQSQRGLAYGVFMAGASLGDALALAPSGVLLSLAEHSAFPGIAFLTPWRQVAFVSAALLVPLIVFVLCLPELQRRTDSRAAELEVAGDESPRFLLHHWRIYLQFMLSAATAAMCGAATYWMPEVLRRSFTLSSADIARDYGLTLLFASIAGAAAGVLVGRFIRDPLRGFRGAVLIYLLMALGLMCFLSGNLAVTLGSIAICVVADASIAVLLLNAVQSITPGGLRGSVASLERFLGTAVGFGIGQPLVGSISDSWMRGDRGLELAMLIVAVPALLCAALFQAIAARQLNRAGIH
jgi:MFS family permease